MEVETETAEPLRRVPHQQRQWESPEPRQHNPIALAVPNWMFASLLSSRSLTMMLSPCRPNAHSYTFSSLLRLM